MRNICIKKSIRKDGTIDIIKIEGGNTGIKKVSNLSKSKRPAVPKKPMKSRIDPETGAKLRNRQKLCQIMKKGREKIYYNIVNREKTCLMYRLSHYPNIRDFNLLQKDFEQFIRRLRRKYEGKFGTIKYFNVLDLHKDMTLHCHGILFAPKTKKRIWVNKAEFEQLWGQGTVWIGRVRKYTNFDYILPLPTNSPSKAAEHIRKKFERYLLLPAYVKIPRSSGFENPQYTQITPEEYEKLKALRVPSNNRKFSYDYGYGIATYTYETFYNDDLDKTLAIADCHSPPKSNLSAHTQSIKQNRNTPPIHEQDREKHK